LYGTDGPGLQPEIVDCKIVEYRTPNLESKHQDKVAQNKGPHDSMIAHLFPH
jgi:hypothetical protein